MANKDDLAVIEFGPMDLRTLEEISHQLAACKTASSQRTGPKQSAGAMVLSVFLGMVDEKLSAFLKEIKARMATKTTT